MDDFKQLAAQAAMKYVEDGMRLGLGTGSTASRFIDLLGEAVAKGLHVVCVPTSAATHAQADARGIKLTTLEVEPFLDLTVDGADEVDPKLRLIKGGGGALLREKIVAAASERMVVIADHTKKVDVLGRFPLPVEVSTFGYSATQRMIALLASEMGLNGAVDVRKGADGEPFVTEGGNYILDCAFSRIPEPEVLAHTLQIVPGVVETGIFLGLADVAILAGPDGIEILEADEDDDEDADD